MCLAHVVRRKAGSRFRQGERSLCGGRRACDKAASDEEQERQWHSDERRRIQRDGGSRAWSLGNPREIAPNCPYLVASDRGGAPNSVAAAEVHQHARAQVKATRDRIDQHVFRRRGVITEAGQAHALHDRLS